MSDVLDRYNTPRMCTCDRRGCEGTHVRDDDTAHELSHYAAHGLSVLRALPVDPSADAIVEAAVRRSIPPVRSVPIIRKAERPGSPRR